MAYSPPLVRLIEEFQKLPGIGPKTAQRLAFHMIKQPFPSVQCFSEALVQAKEAMRTCEICFHLSSVSPCEICANSDRRTETLCVVQDSQDLFALERTGSYHGRYHVLQGLISPLEGIGPEDCRIQELVRRLGQNPGIEEVILALAPSIEGDTTSLYLSKLLKPLQVRLTRIAFGLPAGGELEYADNVTITRALEGRVIL